MIDKYINYKLLLRFLSTNIVKYNFILVIYILTLISSPQVFAQGDGEEETPDECGEEVTKNINHPEFIECQCGNLVGNIKGNCIANIKCARSNNEAVGCGTQLPPAFSSSSSSRSLEDNCEFGRSPEGFCFDPLPEKECEEGQQRINGACVNNSSDSDCPSGQEPDPDNPGECVPSQGGAVGGGQRQSGGLGGSPQRSSVAPICEGECLVVDDIDVSDLLNANSYNVDILWILDNTNKNSSATIGKLKTLMETITDKFIDHRRSNYNVSLKMGILGNGGKNLAKNTRFSGVNRKLKAFGNSNKVFGYDFECSSGSHTRALTQAVAWFAKPGKDGKASEFFRASNSNDSRKIVSFFVSDDSKKYKKRCRFFCFFLFIVTGALMLASGGAFGAIPMATKQLLVGATMFSGLSFIVASSSRSGGSLLEKAKRTLSDYHDDFCTWSGKSKYFNHPKAHHFLDGPALMTAYLPISSKEAEETSPDSGLPEGKAKKIIKENKYPNFEVWSFGSYLPLKVHAAIKHYGKPPTNEPFDKNLDRFSFSSSDSADCSFDKFKSQITIMKTSKDNKGKSLQRTWKLDNGTKFSYNIIKGRFGIDNIKDTNLLQYFICHGQYDQSIRNNLYYILDAKALCKIEEGNCEDAVKKGIKEIEENSTTEDICLSVIARGSEKYEYPKFTMCSTDKSKDTYNKSQLKSVALYRLNRAIENPLGNDVVSLREIKRIIQSGNSEKSEQAVKQFLEIYQESSDLDENSDQCSYDVVSIANVTGSPGKKEDNHYFSGNLITKSYDYYLSTAEFRPRNNPVYYQSRIEYESPYIDPKRLELEYSLAQRAEELVKGLGEEVPPDKYKLEIVSYTKDITENNALKPVEIRFFIDKEVEEEITKEVNDLLENHIHPIKESDLNGYFTMVFKDYCEGESDDKEPRIFCKASVNDNRAVDEFSNNPEKAKKIKTANYIYKYLRDVQKELSLAVSFSCVKSYEVFVPATSTNPSNPRINFGVGVSGVGGGVSLYPRSTRISSSGCSQYRKARQFDTIANKTAGITFPLCADLEDKTYADIIKDVLTSRSSVFFHILDAIPLRYKVAGDNLKKQRENIKKIILVDNENNQYEFERCILNFTDFTPAKTAILLPHKLKYTSIRSLKTTNCKKDFTDFMQRLPRSKKIKVIYKKSS